MQKINYFLQKINPYITLKISVTVDNSDPNPARRSVNQFIFNGSLYTNVIIFPRLIIELREMGGEKKVYSVNNFVSLSPLTAYRFCRIGNEMLEKFKTKDLFIYQGDRLILNKELGTKIEKSFPVNDKRILLKPVVVQDYMKGIECEGVCMAINELSNFALMTIEEFSFLLHTVKELDFNTMGVELLKLIYKINNKNQ